MGSGRYTHTWMASTQVLISDGWSVLSMILWVITDGWLLLNTWNGQWWLINGVGCLTILKVTNGRPVIDQPLRVHLLLLPSQPTAPITSASWVSKASAWIQRWRVSSWFRMVQLAAQVTKMLHFISVYWWWMVDHKGQPWSTNANADQDQWYWPANQQFSAISKGEPWDIRSKLGRWTMMSLLHLPFPFLVLQATCCFEIIAQGLRANMISFKQMMMTCS